MHRAVVRSSRSLTPLKGCGEKILRGCPHPCCKSLGHYKLQRCRPRPRVPPRSPPSCCSRARARPHPIQIPTGSDRGARRAAAGARGTRRREDVLLIERIRFLLETLGLDGKRICAFTFTNKAAGEIAERLAATLGSSASSVKTGTIHAFCAELLREFGSHVGLERGFGIIDDKAQHAVLRRIGRFGQWNGALLRRFSAHRLTGEPLAHRA
jgi:hypothetical protein